MIKKESLTQNDYYTFNILQESTKNDDDFINYQESSQTIQFPILQLLKHSVLFQDEFLNSSIKERISQKFFDLKNISNIKEENVTLFIKLLCEQDVKINNEQYSDLYKLSEIFKIESLQKKLDKYARCHINDVNFMIDLLIDQISDQETNFLITRKLSINLEDRLRDNIKECLLNEKFCKLPVSTLYRIIEKSDKDSFTTDMLYDFISKSFENLFPLFSFIDVQNLSDEKLEDLYDNYINLKILLQKNIFNF